jgi:hypothetical protein
LALQTFDHRLSFAEHIWGGFWRAFFSQATLVYTDDGKPVQNAFRYIEATEPANRQFDVLFEGDLKTANPNILPALVIEDQGLQEQGILLDKRSWWRWSPSTERVRADLIRETFIFHCCARTRGESRLLAGIVMKAIDVFYDPLKSMGMHKIEPRSAGKSIPIKSDSDEVYVDTPVIAPCTFQDRWVTQLRSDYFLERFCTLFAPEVSARFVRTSMAVVGQSLGGYVRTSLNAQDPASRVYARISLDAVNPLSSETYTNTSMNTADAQSARRYVRASMRVA